MEIISNEKNVSMPLLGGKDRDKKKSLFHAGSELFESKFLKAVKALG